MADVRPASDVPEGVDTPASSGQPELPEDTLLGLLDLVFLKAWREGDPVDYLEGTSPELVTRLKSELPERIHTVDRLAKYSSATGQLLAKSSVAYPDRLTRRTSKGSTVWLLRPWASADWC